MDNNLYINRADTDVHVKSYAVSAIKNDNIKMLHLIGGGWQVENEETFIFVHPSSLT